MAHLPYKALPVKMAQLPPPAGLTSSHQMICLARTQASIGFSIDVSIGFINAHQMICPAGTVAGFLRAKARPRCHPPWRGAQCLWVRLAPLLSTACVAHGTTGPSLGPKRLALRSQTSASPSRVQGWPHRRRRRLWRRRRLRAASWAGGAPPRHSRGAGPRAGGRKQRTRKREKT